jgi:hypothetical protein
MDEAPGGLCSEAHEARPLSQPKNGETRGHLRRQSKGAAE